MRAWAPEVRFLEQTTSTNTVAAEWARDGAAEGCIVVADHQTAGRGRMDRSWFSRPGAGLLFSIVLRPSLSVEHFGLINLVAGVAMCRALEILSIGARLKWPNDILTDGKKVCGMLSEMVNGTALILGVGVNVNLSVDDLPAEIRDSATSLSQVTGRSVDRSEVLIEFLGAFGPRYSGLTGQALSEYRGLCETLGKRVRVETGKGFVEGIASDVSETGALILDTGEVIHSGDVIHLR